MRNNEEAPRPRRPVGQRSQQLVGRYFDENAGRTGNPIPTIIVGDHVRPGRYAQKINDCTLLRTIEDATLPPRPRYRRSVSTTWAIKARTNWAGVPTDQDARPADSVADALGGFVSSGVAPSCYRSW
jgi:hypothetical protein